MTPAEYKKARAKAFAERVARALEALRTHPLVRLKKPIRGNLPPVLIFAMAGALAIVDDRDRFPEVGSGKGQRRFQFGEPNRERHLRRLVAMAKVLICLLSHADLANELRAGRQRADGSCDAIRVTRPNKDRKRRRLRRGDAAANKQSSIVAETGLSPDAVSRALRDLKDAGYVTATPKRKRYEVRNMPGVFRWRAYPSVHAVTKTAFKRFGVDLGWLEKQTDRAKEERAKGPTPIVDIRIRRAKQQVVRAQARAAKQAFGSGWTDADAAESCRRMEEAERRRRRE